MKKVLNLIAVFGLLTLMNSCASLTGFEEGRSLGEENSEFGLTFNYSKTPDLFGDEFEFNDTISTEVPTIGFPNVELNYKYGITEKLDVGAKLSTNLNSSAYAKYQVVGDRSSKFALAPGLELGTILGAAYYVGIPVYMSFYPTDGIAININPRFTYQFSSEDLVSVDYLGANFGLMFGKKHKFGLDFGYYSVGGISSSRSSLLTFGLGGKFRFGDNMDSGSSRSGSSSTRRRR